MTRAYDWGQWYTSGRPKADAPVANGCTHRWRIEEPDGRHVLTGQCSKCHSTRMFYASDQEWEKARIVEGLARREDPRWREERAGYGW